MSMKFNTGPYYDDFDPANNFYRVLFKPGTAVQARELNQLQSILQHQVSSVGNHLFKKNSIIIPGGIALNSFADIISVRNIQDPSGLVGQTITNASNFDPSDDTTLDGFITAVILGYRAAQEEGDVPAALYIKYFKTQTDGRGRFNQSETISTVGTSLITFTVDSTLGATVGRVATLSAGTFYTKELFVAAPQQSVIIEVDNTVTTNAVVGLNVVESIVTADNDETLLDNATGSPNQYAPGADRYKVDLVLTFVDPSATINEENFITMMRIQNNTITFINNKTEYAELMVTLARRTYDANGNFIVNGLDTSVTTASDDDYVWANISSGKCYLGGYEYEQLTPTPIAIDKPRGAAYQEQATPVDTYSLGLPYFYVAGGAFSKEVPEKDSLIQFINTNPVRHTFNATSGSVVDLSANTITITNHGLVTGNQIVYTNGGGTSIGGLTSGTTYFVIRDSSSVIRLASSSANALAGTAIDLSTGAVGTSHVINKRVDIIGYGIFKSIEYASIGSVAAGTDVYKAFVDFVSLDKGYTIADIGGMKATATSDMAQAMPILHELRLSNVVGTLAVGQTISSTAVESPTTRLEGLIYSLINNFTYVIKNTLNRVPSTPAADNIVSSSGATAVLRSSFITNYTTSFVPLVEVDKDVIKSLYTFDNATEEFVNNTSYYVVTTNTYTSIASGETPSPVLPNFPNDVYDNYSTSNYFAFITTPGAEQFVDLTGIIEVQGNSYTLDVPGGHVLVGKNAVVYSTVIKTKALESPKAATTVTATIPNPSSSWTALDHQDVVEILKIVDGSTAAVNGYTWSNSTKLVTMTLRTDSAITLNGNDKIVIKDVLSSANTSGNYDQGVNGYYTVKPLSVTSTTEVVGGITFHLTTFTITETFDPTPGTFVAGSAGVVALPPNLTNDTDITQRFNFESGNTAYLSGSGLIKLKKRATLPQGQVMVQYRYLSVGTGNYVSVDSYGSYAGDLSYIGDINNIVDPQNGVIETRRFLDFRTRTSSYFFRNIGSIAASSNILVLRDLNLSTKSAALIGKFVVGPGHTTGASITAVKFNALTGNTQLTLSATVPSNVTGGYYIGLNTSSLSLTDAAAGARSFAFPKDQSRITYEYIKFKPKHVMLFINRQSDVLTVDYQEVSGIREMFALNKNEFKLPLAYIYMSPYTVDLQNVVLTKFENPVYQMIDIHAIKNRVDRAEYYASLALNRDLEQEIADAANETPHSGRGFWNENFMQPLDQDVFSDDFACTVYDRSYVAPGVITRTIGVQFDQSLNQDTWQQTGSALTLPYTETRAFGNPLASKFNNLNPFNMINWTGKLTLNPSVDNWVDTTSDLSATVKNTSRVNSSTVQVTAATRVEVAPVVVNIRTPQVLTEPPPVIPAPPVDEVVISITNLRVRWGRDSAGGNHAITFDWRTNLNRTGRVNTDIHLSPVVRAQGFDGSYATSLINKRYNDPGVKEYLHAGTHFDQRAPNQWR
jgi:hypothetical protein